MAEASVENEVKWNLVLSFESEKPPEQWGYNKYFKAVVVSLLMCPERETIAEIQNSAWDSLSTQQGKIVRNLKKKRDSFFFAILYQGKEHQGHKDSPILLAQFCHHVRMSGLPWAAQVLPWNRSKRRELPACDAHLCQGSRWFTSVWLSYVDKLSYFTLLELELWNTDRNK